MRFMALFDQAPISMQLLAADGQTILVNKAWEALWQLSDGDGVKEHVLSPQYNVLTDAQLEAKGITPYLRQAFAGDSVRIPAVLYDPTELGEAGRARWVTANAHPILDRDGNVQEVFLMHEDITDQVNAQTVLRNSEERFRSLVMATSQMVWTTSPDGRAQEDSPSWRAFTGQSYEDWKDYGWLDAVHPDDRERARHAWAESVRNQSIYETHYRLRRHDGQYRWTVVKGVPVPNPDGTIREWMGANTDITEQRNTEQALQSSEAQLRVVLDTTQQKVFTAMANGDVDYVNTAWTSFTGLSFEEIRDWGWLKFIHPDDQKDNVRLWKHSIDTGESFQFEHRFRRADGQYRWHLSRAVPLMDSEGNIIKWVGSNTDIHEIKVAETELEVRLAEETRNVSLLKKVADASRSLHTTLLMDNIAQLLVQ